MPIITNLKPSITDLESLEKDYKCEINETKAALSGLHDRPLSPDEIHILSFGLELKRLKNERQLARVQSMIITRRLQVSKLDFFNAL